MPIAPWNHVFGDPASTGFDMQAAGEFNKYVSAIGERGEDVSAYGPFVAAGASGYDLQKRDAILAMQDSIVNWLSTGLLNQDVAVGGQAWVKPSDLSGTPVDYTGVNTFYYGVRLSWAYLADNCTAQGGGFAFAATGADGSFESGRGFTALYPKAFANRASSTQYNDELAFTVGDYARCTSDGLVYHCTAVTAGIGTWLRAPDHLPDKRSWTDGGFRPSGTGAHAFISMAAGMICSGDYRGKWLFNQLRDAINYITDWFASVGWISDGVNNVKLGNGAATPGTAAAARADAEANYVLTGAEDGGPYCYSRIAVGGGNATAIIARKEAKAVVSTLADGLLATVDFYSMTATVGNLGLSYTGDPDPADLDVNGNPQTFDANRDTIANLTISKFDTQAAAGAGADVKSVFFGSLTRPNWAPDTGGSTGYNFANGVGDAVSGFAVLKYGVAGGYTYRS